MLKILDKIFILSLISFLVLGAVIVFTQIIGLIFQKGQLIIDVSANLAEPAFMLSAVAGVLGFLIPVIKNKTSNILSEEEIEDQHIEKLQKESNSLS